MPEAVSEMASQWGTSLKSTFLRLDSDLRAIDHSLDAAWIQFAHTCELFNSFSTRLVVPELISSELKYKSQKNPSFYSQKTQHRQGQCCTLTSGDESTPGRQRVNQIRQRLDKKIMANDVIAIIIKEKTVARGAMLLPLSHLNYLREFFSLL